MMADADERAQILEYNRLLESDPAAATEFFADSMHLFDITVLVLSMAGISAYGIRKARLHPGDAKDFLVGSGGGVSVFSLALSVCSGFISSISLLGFPGEVFYNGSMILWYGPMYIIAFPLVAYLFLPVHFELKLTSIYQYLELRFSRFCRSLAAMLFCMEVMMYNAVALYAPAVAISELHGLPMSMSILITAGLSALYISVGGARAGIHTSALQMLFIFITMAAVVLTSFIKADISEFVKYVRNGRRFELFETRVDPRIRHSIPSLLIGGTGNILTLFAANQISLQKYMSMPTLKSAQSVILLNIPLNFIILCLYVLTGLFTFYYYYFCAPNFVFQKNRIFPHFVVRVLRNVPGMTGLMAVAVYSAGISTLSATMMATNSVVIYDVLTPLRQIVGCKALTEKGKKQLSQVIPSTMAAIAYTLALMCTFFDYLILQLAFSIFGVVGGPVLGVFVLGFFIPWVKARAAEVGMICSVFISFALAIVANVKRVASIPLPVNTKCNATFQFNSTDPMLINTVTDIPGPWYMQVFRVSYQYYSVIGLIDCVIIALLIQLLLNAFKCGGNKEGGKVERRLLSKYVHWSKYCQTRKQQAEEEHAFTESSELKNLDGKPSKHMESETDVIDTEPLTTETSNGTPTRQYHFPSRLIGFTPMHVQILPATPATSRRGERVEVEVHSQSDGPPPPSPFVTRPYNGNSSSGNASRDSRKPYRFDTSKPTPQELALVAQHLADLEAKKSTATKKNAEAEEQNNQQAENGPSEDVKPRLVDQEPELSTLDKSS